MNPRWLFISFSALLFSFFIYWLLLLLLQAYFLNPFGLGLIVGSHREIMKFRRRFLGLNFHLIGLIDSWLYFVCLGFGQFQLFLCQLVSFDQMIIQDLLHFDCWVGCLFYQIFLHQSQLKDPILRKLYFFYLRLHDLRLIKQKKGLQWIQVILRMFFQQQQPLFLFLILDQFLVSYQYRQLNSKFQSN